MNYKRCPVGEMKNNNIELGLKEAWDTVISDLEELKQYREIGTVEEFNKSVKEENMLKFYYCESEDDYYIGQNLENFYYARYTETGFEWFMSRYLPWGEHIVTSKTLWKEFTYPSKPKEISLFEWLQGFLKKYCGGTVEECRKAMEKQKAKKILPLRNGLLYEDGWRYKCPNCGCAVGRNVYHPDVTKDFEYCSMCGQRIEG